MAEIPVLTPNMRTTKQNKNGSKKKNRTRIRNNQMAMHEIQSYKGQCKRGREEKIKIKEEFSRYKTEHRNFTITNIHSS